MSDSSYPGHTRSAVMILYLQTGVYTDEDTSKTRGI